MSVKIVNSGKQPKLRAVYSKVVAQPDWAFENAIANSQLDARC